MTRDARDNSTRKDGGLSRGRCQPHSLGTGKPRKRDRCELLSARPRPFAEKKRAYNGELDYRRCEESKRRDGARTREIAGSLTAIRLRGDTSISSSVRDKQNDRDVEGKG